MQTVARQLDYEKELNAEQLAAVQCAPGPALVIAGAGSGKTRCLTYRVAWLLENGIRARDILLLTFTNRAAKEMLERVMDLLPMELQGLWGGTFHSICNRILRRHAEFLGFTQNFTILDQKDAEDLMAASVKETELEIEQKKLPKPKVILSILSLTANKQCAVKEVLETQFPHFYDLMEAFEKIQKVYAEKKQRANSMDFDDLLVHSLTLFEKEADLLHVYQDQFQFILVDEYQDTNALQSRLIELLAAKHRNLMVVGDDAQSIYSWRGADFRNILEFPDRYTDAQVFKIQSNYRSVPEVLALANASISHNTRQFEKNLRAHRASEEQKPVFIKQSDASRQADYVTEQILALYEKNITLNEIAILYRAHFHSMEIQLELTRRGIPFRITSGLKFFEQAHIKDVASFLKIAVNPRDEVSFKRIVRLLPGVGNISAHRLWQQWEKEARKPSNAQSSPSEILLSFTVPKRGQKAWKQLAFTLDEFYTLDGEIVEASQMMESTLEGLYDAYLLDKFPNYESRKQDIEQLMEFSRKFTSVHEFLAQMALLAGVDGDPNAEKERDQDAVNLSTIHQAKGLEWHSVFIVSLAEGSFPHHKIIAECNEEKLEEERRLFYVAVTRAKDQLFLSYPLLSANPYAGVQSPSQFLQELPEELYSIGNN